MIALVDYGAGNLSSVVKGLRAVGAEVTVAAGSAPLPDCTGIVVPGVGHFGATMSLDAQARDGIRGRVRSGTPLLGICLGMQWLFEGSDEAPGVEGLGLLPGRCTRIRAERPLKVPHVGWNALGIGRRSTILAGVGDGAYVYFTHSFAAPVTPDCSATSHHGETFAAVVQRDHVAGVQFHPEKSGDAGLRILANFVAMTRR
jgi:glutamine amidotransferase